MDVERLDRVRRVEAAITELAELYERLSAVAEVKKHSTSRHFAVRAARDLVGRQLEVACEQLVEAARGR